MPLLAWNAIGAKVDKQGRPNEFGTIHGNRRVFGCASTRRRIHHLTCRIPPAATSPAVSKAVTPPDELNVVARGDPLMVTTELARTPSRRLSPCCCASASIAVGDTPLTVGTKFLK